MISAPNTLSVRWLQLHGGIVREKGACRNRKYVQILVVDPIVWDAELFEFPRQGYRCNLGSGGCFTRG